MALPGRSMSRYKNLMRVVVPPRRLAMFPLQGRLALVYDAYVNDET
jgi:hypothetical protein